MCRKKPKLPAFETANQEYIRRSLKLVRLMGMLWPTLELMLGIAVVIVLWLGGRQVLLGRMNVGDFVAFNTYMVQLTWPVIALGWVINIFQRGTASLVRINEILSAEPEIADDPDLVAKFPLPVAFPAARLLEAQGARVAAASRIARRN